MLDSEKADYSRPKTIDEVSSQENTVAVLRKALASTNVSVASGHELCVAQITIRTQTLTKAPPYALLWPTRNRQDIHHPRTRKATVWVCNTINLN